MDNNQTKSGRGGARPGAGRKKGSRNKATADVKALAQKYGAEAIDALASIMRKGDSDKAKAAAAKELLDRGYGKPHQTQDLVIEDRRMVEAPRPATDASEWTARYGPH